MNKTRKMFLLSFIPLLLLIFIYSMMNELKTKDFLSKHSIFEDICFGLNSQLDTVHLHKSEAVNSYDVYISGDEQAEVKVYFNYCSEICFNGTMLSSGDSISFLEEGVPYLVQALDSKDTIFDEGYVTFYFSSTIPAMYITTESGSLEDVHSDKEFTENIYYTVYTVEGSIDSHGEGSMKGRGNSSWKREQKPYSINLPVETELLGMKASQKWALLSNYDELIPQIKNKVALDVASKMKLSNTPQCEFVNLYVNGQYEGLYLLAQRIEVPSAEYLLEFDARYQDEPIHFATENLNIVIKSPSEISHEEKDFISDYIRQAECAVYSEDGINPDTGKSYDEYLDIQSWADIFSIHNFFCQWDVEFASFYLYKEKEDPLIYAGPIWDFDYSCGKIDSLYFPELTSHKLWIEAGHGAWLPNLSRKKDFYSYYKQRYRENFVPILSQFLCEDYSGMIESLDSAVKMDALRWNKNLENVKFELSNLHDWMCERQKFLGDYYENPESYCKITFSYPFGTLRYYAKKGEPLGFLPLDGEDTNRVWLYNEKRTDHWLDENGNFINENTIITKEETFYRTID